ncbi:MAG: serine hydrolase [Bacteroidota bacterium]
MKYFLFPVILLSVLACHKEKRVEMSFPMNKWMRTDPASLGLNIVKVDSALAFLQSKSFEDGIEEVLIIRNGYILYEGDSTEKAHNIYSCSKAFTSTVLGLLVDREILSLDEQAANHDSTLTLLYPKVTFRHFVTMTSGFSAEGRSRWNDENADWSHTPYTPETPHFAPGTHYEYWDEAQMMFGRVLTQVLDEPMQDFLKRELTDSLQMGSWSWGTEQNINGIPINNGCTGVTLNALQLARFGHLYLNRGNWKGKQLLSSSWCEMATTHQVPANIPVYPGDRAQAKGSGSYGFNWWVNSREGLSRMPDAPLGVAYLSGLNHNVCCIIPEWNMVIVRMGDDKNPPEGKYIVWNEFLRLIGEAIEG